jgi:hypothetical protein
MLYEWRIYSVVPGRMDALNERFANITLRMFEKHGIKVIGFWEAVIGTSNTLYYMLAFNDMAHREKAWNAFASDTEWLKAKKETEDRAGGPLVERVENTLLKPTRYSPLK